MGTAGELEAGRAARTVASLRDAGRARRTMVAGTARMNDLQPDAQRRLAAEVSAMSLIEHVTQDARVKPGSDAPTAPTPVAITAQRLLASLAA